RGRGAGGPAATTPAPASVAHLRHELRTPLNHVLGYSEMLLEDHGDAGELAVALRRVREDGRALLGIVEESLAPARLAGGGPDLRALASGLSAPLARVGEAVDQLTRLASAIADASIAGDAERIATAV